LTKIRHSQGQYLVIERIRMSVNSAGSISSEAMILILTQVGSISNFEASKVANFFMRNGVIQVQHFEEYYRKCVQIQALNSASV
jgi:hypothetical protein